MYLDGACIGAVSQINFLTLADEISNTNIHNILNNAAVEQVENNHCGT